MLADKNTILHLDLASKFRTQGEYSRVCSKDLTLDAKVRKFIQDNLVEHLIVFKQPTQTIQSLITKKVQGNGRKYLNETRNAHHLGLLHLAVITGSDALCTWLIELGCKVTAQDCRGWTVFHHAAALPDERMTKLLSAHLPKKGPPRTKLGASPEDIRAMVGIKCVAASCTVLLDSEGNQIDPYHAKAEGLKVLGVERYSDYPLFEGKWLPKLWEQEPFPDEGGFDIDKLTNHLFQQVVTQGKCAIKVMIQASLPGAGTGLFAATELSDQIALLPYGGLHTEYESSLSIAERFVADGSTTAYLLNDIDAAKVGSAARLSNDGFPNCHMHSRRAFKGSPASHLLCVANAGGVRNGQELVWDYGLGEVELKWGPYRVIGKDRMLAFFRSQKQDIGALAEELTNRYKAICKRLEQTQKYVPATQSRYLNFWGTYSKVAYCLNTPSALLTLYCEGIAKPSEWLALSKDWEMYAVMTPAQFRIQRAYTCVFLQYLTDFDVQISKLGKLKSSELKQRIGALIGDYSMHHIAYAMQRLLEDPALELEGLVTILKNYDLRKECRDNPLMQNLFSKSD